MPFFVDESVRLAGIVSFMCALALAFLALRLWGRGLRRVGLFPSDYLAAVAMVRLPSPACESEGERSHDRTVVDLYLVARGLLICRYERYLEPSAPAR